MKNPSIRLLAVLTLSLLLTTAPLAMAAGHGDHDKKEKTAIVIASFGTTVPSGVKAISNILERVRAAYPGTEVRLTFTSNIIRSVWHKRQQEAQKWLDQGIPKEIIYSKNIISTFGDLQEDGYKNIIVQPTHMFYMEQSHDLESYIRGISSIKTLKKSWQPYDTIALGRPAMGKPGDEYDFHEDVKEVVATLADDFKQAREQGAILLYMGHGNEYWPSGIYSVAQKEMRAAYPEVQSFIGTVEGTPSLDDLMGHLKACGKKKIMVKPFMIVAGDHATNDMAGDEEDSWKSLLTAAGFEVTPVLKGLGENNAFADIFVKHIEETATARHLKLQ